MSANQKLNVLLVQAKEEYVAQIADCLAPFVINVINTYWSNAQKNASIGGGFVHDLQRKLREIPTWNQSMIDSQVVAITNKYKYLPELIAAVFVSYVKILSSVKIHANKPHIQLKLPADDVFVHKVYVLTAKSFYSDPGLVKSPRDIRLAVVKNSVERAVRELLPIEDILHAYLGASVDNDGIHTNEIDDDDIDLSPSPQAQSPVVERSPTLPQVLETSLSPVSAVGDIQSAQSPHPTEQMVSKSPEDTRAEAIQQLKDLLNKTAPPAVPVSNFTDQPPHTITVQTQGAFVSPKPTLGFDDVQGNSFFK